MAIDYEGLCNNAMLFQHLVYNITVIVIIINYVENLKLLLLHFSFDFCVYHYSLAHISEYELENEEEKSNRTKLLLKNGFLKDKGESFL